VVLDNCEHVRAAAADVAAVVVDAGGVVLATSRERLRVPGERLMPLPPLADPAAVELFTNHATGVDPSFRLHPGNHEAVLQICRRLDGMPLAIELAASRVRTLSVAEILQRLDTRFRLLRSDADYGDWRQRTLLGSVQWSYDLLDPGERGLFCGLSTFAGGFDLAAAHAVAAVDGADELDVVELLDGLVARSMIVADVDRPAARYGMLETLRQFGAAQLSADDAREVRSRHACHYLAVAEHAGRLMSTRHPAAACDTFESEWDNLRLAFEWAEATGDVDRTLRLVLACESYAISAIRFELLDWAERAIGVEGAADHDLWPAVAGASSRLRLYTGDVAGARALAMAALDAERARRTGHCFESVAAAFGVYWMTGETARAAELVPYLEVIAAATNDPIQRGYVRYFRILSQLLADEPERARPLSEEALRDARRSGNPHELAFAYLGMLAMESKHGGGQTAKLYAEVCRWASEAGSDGLANMAAGWIATFPVDGDPRAQLLAVHSTLLHARQHDTFHNLELSIYPLLPHLVESGRFNSAALLLGGLDALETAALDDRRAVAKTLPVIADALGPRFDELVADGRQLTKRDILALATDETELLLTAPDRPKDGKTAAAVQPSIGYATETI
jgi:predicted ATPase